MLTFIIEWKAELPLQISENKVVISSPSKITNHLKNMHRFKQHIKSQYVVLLTERITIRADFFSIIYWCLRLPNNETLGVSETGCRSIIKEKNVKPSSLE